jgi:hypothetical protein
MQRYFMTIPEASQLVLQAGAMGSGGEIFILDMGEPVKIVDLARDLITLSGFRPGIDIDIKFNGVRPGEKLFEQLATDAEHADKTKHPKIFIGRIAAAAWPDVVRRLDALIALGDSGDARAVREGLRTLVPEYTGGIASGSSPIPTLPGIGAEVLAPAVAAPTVAAVAPVALVAPVAAMTPVAAMIDLSVRSSRSTGELEAAKPRRADGKTSGSHPVLVPG